MLAGTPAGLARAASRLRLLQLRPHLCRALPPPMLPPVPHRRMPRAPLQVRHSFGLSHEEITALAAKEAPGCGGATMLPYMLGERTPNWPHATGAILGGHPS